MQIISYMIFFTGPRFPISKNITVYPLPVFSFFFDWKKGEFYVPIRHTDYIIFVLNKCTIVFLWAVFGFYFRAISGKISL